ncbi:MAG: hypothetical protein ACRCYR_15430 [Phycicoccus sp.]
MTRGADITALLEAQPVRIGELGSEVDRAQQGIDTPPPPVEGWTGAAADVSRMTLARQTLDLDASRRALANGGAAIDGFTTRLAGVQQDAVVGTQEHEFGVDLQNRVRQYSGMTLSWADVELLTSVFRTGLEHQRNGVTRLQGAHDGYLIASTDLGQLLAQSLPPEDERIDNPIENRRIPPIRPEHVKPERSRDQPDPRPPNELQEEYLRLAPEPYRFDDLWDSSSSYDGWYTALKEQGIGYITGYNGLLSLLYGNEMTRRSLQAQETTRDFVGSLDRIARRTQERVNELDIERREGMQQYRIGVAETQASNRLDFAIDQTSTRMEVARGEAEEQRATTIDTQTANAWEGPHNTLRMARFVEQFPDDPYVEQDLLTEYNATLTDNGGRQGGAINEMIDRHGELDTRPYQDVDFTGLQLGTPVLEEYVGSAYPDVPTAPSLQSEQERADRMEQDGRQNTSEGASRMQQSQEELDKVSPNVEADPGAPYSSQNLGRPVHLSIPHTETEAYVQRQRDALTYGVAPSAMYENWEWIRDQIPFGDELPEFPTLPNTAGPGQAIFQQQLRDNVDFGIANSQGFSDARQDSAELSVQGEEQDQKDFAQNLESWNAGQDTNLAIAGANAEQDVTNTVEDSGSQQDLQEQEQGVSARLAATERQFQQDLGAHARQVQETAAAQSVSYNTAVPGLRYMAHWVPEAPGGVVKIYQWAMNHTDGWPDILRQQVIDWAMEEGARRGVISTEELSYYHNEFQKAPLRRRPTPVEDLI